MGAARASLSEYCDLVTEKLFVERFLVECAVNRDDPPGHYDDARQVVVDERGRPLVELSNVRLSSTETKAWPTDRDKPALGLRSRKRIDAPWLELWTRTGERRDRDDDLRERQRG